MTELEFTWKLVFAMMQLNKSLIQKSIPVILSFMLVSCAEKSSPLFTKMPASETGIDFINHNTDSDSLSIMDYLYYYNGAGVAAGDINNDGLPDLYFASNRGGNHLYLNKGNLKFEDITSSSGTAGKADWTTGVSMADVNADGFLDIYVSTVANHTVRNNAGEMKTFFPNSKNQLFINNRNNTFTESAAAYGLDLKGYNTQAAFFDYDKDGDLDMFQLQHSTHQTNTYSYISQRKIYSEVSGGKLMQNNAGHFNDVTKQSGIISSQLGYGLGLAIADLNQDGFDDIYVGNDFHESDYYYINNRNGGFTESSDLAFEHQSKFSMGNDVADLNNDGWPDIVTVDMLPEDEKVLKSSLSDDPLDVSRYLHSFGFQYQYSRNSLHLNIGRGLKFAEIGLYSNMAATDWSWAPLVADFDMDGINDLFVSNGIKNRPNDLDYLKFNQVGRAKQEETGEVDEKEILAHQPKGDWHNYLFKGNADLRFADSSASWGMGEAGLSQSATFADLDADGDLDLVTNNMNEVAGVYRCAASTRLPQNKSLIVELKGDSVNPFAIGAKVFAFAGPQMFYQQLQPSRGFMGSVEPVITIGTGTIKTLDSVVIIWPGDSYQVLKNVTPGKKITVRKEGGNLIHDYAALIKTLLKDSATSLLTDLTSISSVKAYHDENDSYIDFNNQWFLPHELSTAGPRIAVADVNGDGLQDFFTCAAKGQTASISLQHPDGTFHLSTDTSIFAADKNAEDVDALFFDADKDGDQDLYVASGGYEYPSGSPFLNDRLYLNDGHGIFHRSTGLPAMTENKSIVRGSDIDHDGDIDLFVGGRANAASYGRITYSFLLENDGKGNFTIATQQVAPTVETVGLVTDAAWIDVDKDGWEDLLVVGEWMPPRLFRNENGKLNEQGLGPQTGGMKGWWCSIFVTDINADGYPDALLGNYGLNSKLAKGAKMLLADVMQNKRYVQLLTINKDGKDYPFVNKENLEKELPYLKKEFLGYSLMAGKTVQEIFGSRLNNAAEFTSEQMASVILTNNRKGQFNVTEMPGPLQWQPVFAFAKADFNKDGKQDIMAGGNFSGTMPFEGRYDALALSINLNVGNGHLQTMMPLEKILQDIRGEIRSLAPIQLANGKKGILVGINNGPVKLLGY